MVTVKQLIEALKRIPKDTKVYLSSDEEGNAFGEIDGWGSATLKKGGVALVLYPGIQHQFDDLFKLD